MKMKILTSGLLSRKVAKPIAKVALEPLYDGLERSDNAVNPLQLRGLFVS